MKCKGYKCAHYEYWDTSYDDEELGYQEHIIEFCHHAEDGINCKNCADCENWNIYDDHECNYKYQPVKDV